MPDPVARRRTNAESQDVSAFPPLNQGGSLNVYAMESAAPASPSDVAAFPHAMGGGPDADEDVGPTTPCEAVIIHNSISTDNITINSENVYARVVVQGSAGDEVGLLLFSDGLSDTYAELRIRIGAGTSGKIRLRYVHSGYEESGWTEESECDANEYDLPPDTPITLRICYIGFFVVENMLTGTVFNGSQTYELGTTTIGLSPGIRAGLCIAEGSAVTFDDFEFYGAYPPQNVNSGTGCEECMVCEHSFWIGDSDGTQLDDWTQVGGTWTNMADVDQCPDDSGVETASANAVLIHDKRWASDNLWIVVRICGDDTPPFQAKVIFSYVDSDNYWYMLYDVDDDPIGAGVYLAVVSVYHRVGGVDTLIDSSPVATPLFGYVDIGIYVFDCNIIAGTFGSGAVCIENAALNNTGKFGVGTGTVTDQVRFANMQVFCTEEFDCGDAPDVVPPDDTPVDPPVLDCCSTDLEIGTELNVDFFDVTADTECTADDCIVVDTWLNDLNSTTFTVAVIEIGDNFVVLEGDTGLGNTCITGTGTWWIRVNIFKVSETDCVVLFTLFIQGDEHHPECTLYWVTDPVAAGGACSAAAFFWRGANADPFCCVDPPGTSIASLSVP